MTDRPAPRRTLVSIQMLRGIAASTVVVYHASLIGADYTHVHILAALTEPGKFGVNLFFVLSGFIICFAHHGDVGRTDRIGRYVWRRVTRIYPTYWFFTLAYIAAALAGFGNPDFSWEGPHLASTFTLFELTPETVRLPLQVAWTLFYEMQFYLLFLSFLVSRRLGIGLFALWAIYIVSAFFTGLRDPLNLWAPWNINFLLGCGVFLLHQRTPVRMVPALFAFSMVGIVIASVGTDYDLTPIEGDNALYLVLLAFAFAALILGCLVIEDRFDPRFQPLLMLLGNASYSTYLVHSGIISAVFILARKLHLLAMMPAMAWFLIALIAGLVGGVLAYLWVEKPLLNLIRAASTPRKAPVLNPAQ